MIKAKTGHFMGQPYTWILAPGDKLGGLQARSDEERLLEFMCQLKRRDLFTTTRGSGIIARVGVQIQLHPDFTIEVTEV